MSEVSPAPHSVIFLRSAHRALAAQSLDGTMNFIALIVAAFASFAAAQAQVINHNLVRPFPQPKPVTVSEKAAVRFKPQLKIDDGCHPYPAVQKDGSISGGPAGRAAGRRVHRFQVWLAGVRSLGLGERRGPSYTPGTSPRAEAPCPCR